MSGQSIKQAGSKLEVQLDVLLIQEDGVYVAYCPALDLSSYGDTVQDVKQAFTEALEIFMEETATKGTLESVLLDLGWALQKHPEASYRPPTLNLGDLLPRFKSTENVLSETVQIPV